MRDSARIIIAHESAKARAVAKWRKGKSDTLKIAHSTGLSEADVCRAIAADQDARHRARAAASTGVR